MEFKKLDELGIYVQFYDRNNIVIKTMMVLVALKKANIEVGKFDEEISNVEFLEDIRNCALNNISVVKEKCDQNLYDIFDSCLNHLDGYDFNEKHIYGTISIINDLTFDEIYKFILSNVNSESNRYEFNTPQTLSQLAIKLLYENDNQTWIDMGCGNGNFLTELSKENKYLKCYGEEINWEMHLIAKIKLYASKCNYEIKLSNVLNNEYDEVANVGFANTPFQMRLSRIEFDYNIFNRYISNMKANQNADWIFADRLLQSIKDRGIIVMTEGSLFNQVDVDQRKTLLDSNLIEGIIKLPANIFNYTGVMTSLVIFNKDKKDRNVKFLDASNMFIKGRRVNELDVDKIVEAYNSKSVLSVSFDKICEENYSLNVIKYIDVNEITLKDEIILDSVIKDLYRGAQISASDVDEFSKVTLEDKTVKLISVGDIQNNSFDNSSLQVIKDNGKLDRYLIKNGDILISSKSTKIKTCVVELNSDERIVATGSLLVLRLNEDKMNPVYLKTFFDSSKGSKILSSLQTGTTIISINASAIRKMRVSCVDKKLQDKIAEEYMMKLVQFKVAQEKMFKLEKEINSVFDNFIGE